MTECGTFPAQAISKQIAKSADYFRGDTALAGSEFGGRLAKHLSGTQGRLTTVFAGLIFIVVAYMLWKSAAAL